jgi:integrase
VTHTIHRLSAVAVAKAKAKPGQRVRMLNDGGGLMLRVTATGGKSWIFRYMDRGKSHDLGLGPLHTVSLADARDGALRLRKERLSGGHLKRDVVTHHKVVPTFEGFATNYIDLHAGEWRGRRTEQDWRGTLATHIYPELGKMPVDRIDTSDVLRALRPLWEKLPEQGSRVRGRVETILDAAGAAGHRDAAIPNPARWSGHLEHLMPAAPNGDKHHPAIPYPELPAFMGELGERRGHSGRALRFLILTAARAGEVRNATWDQLDLDNALWTIPAGATKAGREQRVPLSPPAIELLRSVPREGKTARHPFPIAGSAMLMLLKREMQREFVPHGFRSTFSTWVAEETDTPEDIREAALGHFNRDPVAAAYQRGDLLAKRRRLMERWGNFCIPSSATVIPLRSA